MFEKIIVPLDGSKIAEKALDAAIYYARTYEAKLLLVQITHLPVTMMEAMGPNYYELRDQCLKDSEKYLAKISEQIDLPDQVESKVAEGHPIDKLLEICESSKAELVIMTSHGRSGLDRWLLGSVTENFARRAVCPVLVLRADQTIHLPLGHSVLVPLDGSALAEGILPFAKQLAGQAGGTLTLLRSHHSGISFEFASHDLYPGKSSRKGDQDGESLAQEYLENVSQQIEKETELKTSFHLAESYPPEAILEEAGRCNADLIAMTSHGATGVAKWVFGSVAEKVLRHADRPVLILKSEWSRKE